ncbi:conserved hypothetical protein [Histoplasma capsulatum G186AR]|uniref:Major facilitator superfamily (MFS) profile domain-containing protein n=2 Tax=Ajellomyces capsulatus TaxID=5037 RepID=C0P1C7_AJECG|nr:uncharacterized protein HCBG_09207 [Histoplasma capsulatum G186AR]EEH02547.1 conserved hypothetical protein [Histoplasma capsulatum G186AR]KAG5287823.1 MFS multidrug transporter [Histoplasma capsulatum]QSS70390.1 MFS multidrug transporter [Histoplasma capsulatum G186AR]
MSSLESFSPHSALRGNVASSGAGNALDNSDDATATVRADGVRLQGGFYENSDTDSSSISSSLNGDAYDPHDRLLGQSGTSGHLPASNSPSGRPPFVGEHDTSAANVVESNGYEPDEEKPVSWASLPKKTQLIILTIARLSEPLTQTSLQAYIFYQLKSFDPSLPDSAISARAGFLQGCSTAAQFATAMIWGRLADTHFMGRKRVLVVGLFGTSIACVGFGFSQSFIAAAIFRTMGGALNSNIGVMRTMISEFIVEKKYQSRAFLLQPMCFNIGVIIGPILGGLLADPLASYPGLFGPHSFFGGQNGVWWMKKWPYALPNVINAVIVLISALAVLFGLDETHETAKYRSDWGRKISKMIGRHFKPDHTLHNYHSIDETYDIPTAGESIDQERSAQGSVPAGRGPMRIPRRKRMSFSQIWTGNVLLTLLTQFVLAVHLSAFNALIFIFLPTPRAPEGSRRGFFHFGGGLGMPSSKVGFATAIIGLFGLPLQIFVYPRVHFHLGTLKSLRAFIPFSALANFLVPFLALVPNRPYLVWPALAAVFSVQVISRTFSLPAAIILVNNSVTDPSVLGTVHGVAQSVTSAARTLGPVVGGWGLGLALKYNIVGAVWWALAVLVLLGWGVSWTIFEDSGLEKKSLEQSHESEGSEH